MGRYFIFILHGNRHREDLMFVLDFPNQKFILPSTSIDFLKGHNCCSGEIARGAVMGFVSSYSLVTSLSPYLEKMLRYRSQSMPTKPNAILMQIVILSHPMKFVFRERNRPNR